MPDLATYVAQFVALLGGAAAVGLGAERLRIPYSVALLVVGVAVTPLARVEAPFAFPSGLLFVFLPALVFEAALGLDRAALMRRARPILVLAVPGVIFTALVVAAGAMAFAHVGPAAAFVLGAILSATDPVAVIATFRRLTVPRDLATIVEAEALANDGVALVLFTLGVRVALGAPAGVWRALGEGVYAIAVGIAIGVACAYVVVRLLHGLEGAEFYAVASIVLAYGAYLLADRLGGSGIFATAAAGIAVRSFARYAPPRRVVREVESFWGALAFLANSLVFLFMGFTFDLRSLVAQPAVAGVALVLVAVSRAILAYGALPLAGIARRAWQHVVAWAGLRGALAIALALDLPRGFPDRDAVIAATFAVVLVTLVAQGLTIEPLLRRLQLRD